MRGLFLAKVVYLDNFERQGSFLGVISRGPRTLDSHGGTADLKLPAWGGRVQEGRGEASRGRIMPQLDQLLQGEPLKPLTPVSKRFASVL